MYEYVVIRRELRDSAEPVKVLTATDVVNYVVKNCQSREEMWKEMAWVLVLHGGKITGHYCLSVGSTKATGFDAKEVAKVAIDSLADAVILVHNHPSGSCLPSKADIAATDSVRKALRLFDIDLLDHVVIGTDEHFSFAIDEKVKD